MAATNIFVSYSHRDIRWVEEGEFGLIPFLKESLSREGVEIWCDPALEVGDQWRNEIAAQIERAQIAILLISQAFLNSEFIRRSEMPLIKQRVDSGQMLVIPILVDYTDWEAEDELSWIADRQMLPSAVTPLIDFTTNEPEWKRLRVDILRKLRGRIQQLRKPSAPPTEPPRPPYLPLSPAEIEICELHSRKGHARRIQCVGVTLDGRLAVTGAQDKTLKAWDLDTATELYTLEGHSAQVNALAIAPDGQWVVSGSSDRTLIVWDLARRTKRQIVRGAGGLVTAVVVMPDGRRILSGADDNMLRVWHLESGRELSTLRGHTRTVKALALTPDGTRVVSGSADGTVRVWGLEDGTELLCLEGHKAIVSAIAVTQDGQQVLAGDWQGMIKLWDLETGSELRTLEGHRKAVSAVVVLQDGRQMVSTSWDHWLKVWDLRTGQVIGRFDTGVELNACDVAPDGRTIVVGDGGGCVRVLRIQSAEP
jgi:hypothetical protein